MARRKRKTLDLTTLFQSVSDNLVVNQASLNQADEYNHDHGDNMVEIFNVINEAIAAKQGEKPARQLAYASELLGQRSQSGSAKIYADGLAQASQKFKGRGVTPDNISGLLGSLLGGQVAQPSSNATSDLLGGLLGGVTGGQGTASQPSGGSSDLLGSLLGGLTGGQGSAPQPSASSQPGLDIGDLLNAGMAFMSSQQQGESPLQSIIQAFVSATQVGQKDYRAQSGELVANTILEMLGKLGSR
jgi:hypothetical protein